MLLRGALGFFIVAIIALALGAGNIAGTSLEIARILIVLFLIFAVISGIFHIFSTDVNPMLDTAIGFFVLAIISLALGYGGVAGISMEIAYILIAVFIILSIISGIVHIFRGRGKRG